VSVLMTLMRWGSEPTLHPADAEPIGSIGLRPGAGSTPLKLPPPERYAFNDDVLTFPPG